jgi:Xaa-Pro aminopeptidase
MQKRPPTVVIKAAETREQLQARRLERRLQLFADLTISCKAQFSILTADTIADAPGPGAYKIGYKAVEISRTVSLPKAARFGLKIKDEKTPLEINYKWVQQKIPGVAIQNQTQLTEKIKKIKQEEEVREIQRAQRIIDEAKMKKEEELRQIVGRKKLAAAESEQKQPTEKERLFEIFRIVSTRSSSWTS